MNTGMTAVKHVCSKNITKDFSTAVITRARILVYTVHKSYHPQINFLIVHQIELMTLKEEQISKHTEPSVCPAGSQLFHLCQGTLMNLLHFTCKSLSNLAPRFCQTSEANKYIKPNYDLINRNLMFYGICTGRATLSSDADSNLSFISPTV